MAEPNLWYTQGYTALYSISRVLHYTRPLLVVELRYVVCSCVWERMPDQPVDQVLSVSPAMTIGAAKACMTITLRYSATRLTFGPTGKSDTPILKVSLATTLISPTRSFWVSPYVNMKMVKTWLGNHMPPNVMGIMTTIGYHEDFTWEILLDDRSQISLKYPELVSVGSAHKITPHGGDTWGN